MTSLIYLSKLLEAGIRFVIAASYAMRHIRKPNDLDIQVHEQDWIKFMDLTRGLGVPCMLKQYKTVGLMIQLEDTAIDSFPGSHPPGFSYTDLEKEGYVLDEHERPSWTLDQMVRWKKAFDRDKDRADLMLVDSYNHYNEE